jgi:hypothetical protein
MSMRRLALAPWILIGTLTVGSVAHAGCCDDAWSCIAAVATAGLSCQVQGIVDTVKALNDTVNSLFNDLKTRTADIINDARQAVEQASADVRSVREKAIADLNDASTKAHAIVSPRITVALPVARTMPLNTGANSNSSASNAAVSKAAVPVQTKATSPKGEMPAPVTPADPEAVKTALNQADKYIADLKEKSALLGKDCSNAEQQALSAVIRHVALANRIALDAALEPLKLLGDSLLDLISHPERIFDPSAQIEADLRRISSEIPAMLDRIGDEVSKEATTDLEQARGPAQQLQDQAAVATSVVAAMQKLANGKTQHDLDALNKLVPAVSKQGVTVLRGVMLPTGIAGRHELLTSAVAKLQASKMPVIAKHRATVSNIVFQWSQIKSQTQTRFVLEANAPQKANSGLQQLLGKGSKTDLDKRKQQLLDEAKRRFGRDPKTLQKVQEYIQTHST